MAFMDAADDGRMDEWPPDRDCDDDTDDDWVVQTHGAGKPQRDRFSESVGDAWESSFHRSPFAESEARA